MFNLNMHNHTWIQSEGPRDASVLMSGLLPPSENLTKRKGNSRARGQEIFKITERLRFSMSYGQ